MLANHDTLERCGGCGLNIVGGTAGCQSLMDELLARDFTDVTYFRVHRLLVDTYCLQHPDKYCVSFKSFAAHLVHLCWSLESGGSRAVPSDAIRRWVERHPHLTKPPVPHVRGALMINDVVQAPGAAAHERAVEEWARSTWDAYAALQPVAREWLRLARATKNRKG